MNKEVIFIDNRECIGYFSSNSKYLLIQPVDEYDIKGLDNEVNEILGNTEEKFSLVALKINDWNNELSPWQAPAVFKNDSFGVGAKETLAFIEEKLLPTIKEKYNITKETKVILGGYSLAALFSLWSGYKSKEFSAIAAASPSVWFPSWKEFMMDSVPLSKNIYLSLGDKEEKTNNTVMSTVGDNIRLYEQILTSKRVNTILEWNNGGHFKDSDKRVAKAFLWCLENNR